MMMKSRPTGYIIGTFVFLMIAIILACYGIPTIIYNVKTNKLALVNGSKAYEYWKEVPFSIDFKVYIFNLTNPEEVNEGGKPNFVEVGPYVYDEYRTREIIAIDDENDTITYNLSRRLQFNQDKSKTLSEDDILTHINLAYMAILIKVNDMMPSMLPVAAKAIELLFEGGVEDPFSKTRVRDLLFDGIYLNCSASDAVLSLLCSRLRLNPSTNIRPSEDETGFLFSMLYHLNHTFEGPSEVKRGSKNLKELGQVVSYKGKMDTSRAWKNPYCSALNGTDGNLFPLFNHNLPDHLYMFQPQLCRSLLTELVDSKAETFNISTIRYEITWRTLMSKSGDPSNKCFCQRKWSQKHDSCLINGGLDLEPCLNVPIVMTFPHFYLASEELLDYYDGGIEPDRDRHTSFVEIEPMTGILMRGSQKVQFNIELWQTEKVPQLTNVSSGLFPVLWIDEGAEVTEDIAAYIRSSKVLLTYVNAFRWVLLGLGIAAFLISIAFVLFAYRSSRLNIVTFTPPQNNLK